METTQWPEGTMQEDGETPAFIGFSEKGKAGQDSQFGDWLV